MSLILETKALTKKFGGLIAVNSLDLQVEEGEILGLIGPNGAGKSTVFGLVSGFMPVSSGHVIFDGKDITNHLPYKIARAGIARAFQQSLTFNGMTVLDNVLVGFHKSHEASLASSAVRSKRARAEEKELTAKAIELLEFLGIAHLRDEKPESLPHGHQKALGVAIALASEPKLLLLDEPATGMNPSESDMMISHIHQVRKRGVTVVVVEHDMRVVRSVCDRLVCMNFGQKLCEGSPDYVTSHPEVCEAYLGKGPSVLLEVKDLVCKYGVATALKGVSCNVNEGEIVALVGANGAGKTTLLRTLSGLMRPASGQVIFSGKRIDGRRPHEILKLGVAHVPEGRLVIANMTVLDNLKMGAYLRRDLKQIQTDIEEMYEHFPVLKDRRTQKAGSLSGGEQQMLAVARALMSSPRLVLMDEPSMGLSPKLVETVRDIVVNMHQRGLSILLVEQNAVMALSIADRAYVLEVGKVALEGDARVVAKDEGVKKAYLGGLIAVATPAISTDLLIIGGGGSGLAAAVRARELGVKDVTILEKTSRLGGNAWLAVVMLGLGDPMHLGPDMTAWRDETFAGLMQSGRWALDPRLIGAFVDTYPEMISWLMDKGLTCDVSGFDVGGRKFSTLCFKERRGDYQVADPARGPGFLGQYIGDLLADDARRLGVNVRTKTGVKHILLDEHGGAVRGVVAEGPDGELEVKAPRVILAAGGFGANEAMMRRYFPEQFENEGPINKLCLGSQTGDGLVMAEEIGLQFGPDMDAGVIGPGHHPWSHSLHEAVHRPEMLWVNTKGVRFTNESLSVMSGWALLQQPESSLWALFDEATLDYIVDNPNPRQMAMGGAEWLKPLRKDLATEAGWTRRTAAIADTVEELAAKIGAPAAALQASVERYNQLCDQARDADFVKPASLLRPLRVPPYYAVLGVRFCHGTEGGPKIDERMQVRTRDGQVVEGLWATGDNTSGWVVQWGLPGTTLAFAFTSGYIAAQSAAAFINSSHPGDR